MGISLEVCWKYSDICVSFSVSVSVSVSFSTPAHPVSMWISQKCSTGMSRYVRHNFFPMGPGPEPQILEGILSNEENSRKPEKGFCFRITALRPKQNQNLCQKWIWNLFWNDVDSFCEQCWKIVFKVILFQIHCDFLSDPPGATYPWYFALFSPSQLVREFPSPNIYLLFLLHFSFPLQKYIFLLQILSPLFFFVFILLRKEYIFLLFLLSLFISSTQKYVFRFKYFPHFLSWFVS